MKKPDSTFYQHLGELFYAIAAADKVVKAEEYNALIEMVIDDWKIYNTVSDFHNHADGYQIELAFNLNHYKSKDAQQCFNNFQNYARANAKHFSSKKIKLILKTAQTIAEACSSTNKSELIMLAKLELLFKETIFKK